ncbi:putative bifunctional diguanylate cyclase/phosphodiesterase [Pseudonocardia humida]|uniref:EAL domain-containing protein n=1 Tax=Pseudonocardia humida TaxID=2800819 RepID=A0ABT1A143_9PSEU|nr:EAL domain-containing protein [Pseudonocardia humida]MCO1656715.1 EAL domain-containing protein [Pseudonocardia humida]
MTSPEPSPRHRASWPLRAFAAVLTLAIVATAAFVGMNAVRLSQVNALVQATQSRSLTLSNTQREALQLVLAVTAHDQTRDARAIDVQRGLLFRHINVAIASYPQGSIEAVELTEVKAALQRFPWDRLITPEGTYEPLRPLAVAMASQSEKRLHGLYVDQEQGFYATTAASLDAAQNGQVSSAVLVGLLLALSGTAVLAVNRRGRSALAVANDQLYHQAHHDSLTDLPNRALLIRRLRAALEANPDAVSVLLVDLDGFKDVNDTLGHPAGDELLRIAAQRLAGCVRDGDTAARLGGDEFAVLSLARSPSGAPSPTPPGHGQVVGQRVVDVLHRSYRVAGRDVRVSASVGVTRGRAGASAEDLIRDADIAMYAAKNTGKGRVAEFDPDMRTRASRRTSMQQELAEAVELGQIEAHFQPIIDLQTLRPTTLEALARWRPDGRRQVPAEEFIAVAEETGTIADIGRAVLRSACRETRGWRALPGHGELSVAVNVSMQQVLSGRLTADVEEALADSGLPAGALVLEITESAALEDSDRVAAEISGLRASGVRIAVDDFGAGYSSLSCLMRLPADLLKIDRTLLDFVTTRDGSLVKAVAELGRTLGLLVVVEGVETSDHLARAREAACDAAQGFHFSRPLAPVDVPAYLAGWSAPRTAGQGAGTARG